MTRHAVVALCAALVASSAHGQDLARYRSHALGSSVAAVVAALGVTVDKVHTLHERPGRIQQLEWMAPYVESARTPADPVRAMTFAFYNDALYQILVEYDADRTDGMTDADLVQALAATYGPPLPRSSARRPAGSGGDVAVATWESSDSSMALLRSRYGPGTQLLLRSTALGQHARLAVQEALRLEALETPLREAARRKALLAEEAAARERLREANRSAFRP